MLLAMIKTVTFVTSDVQKHLFPSSLQICFYIIVSLLNLSLLKINFNSIVSDVIFSTLLNSDFSTSGCSLSDLLLLCFVLPFFFFSP